MPSPSPVRQLLGPALVTLLLAGVLAVGAPAAASGDNVLVFGDRASERTQVTSRLQALGHTVTNVVTLPGDVSGYDAVWHVSAVTALTAAERERLAGFVTGGGGLYLSGEFDCSSCLAPLASVEVLVRDLVGSHVDVGGAGSMSGDFAFNTAAAAGAGNTPNVLSAWSGASVGGLGGVHGENVLITHAATSRPVAAVWPAGDLVAGVGRLALVMDVSWLFNTTSADTALIQNLQTFLTSTDEPVDNTAPEVHLVTPPAGEVVEVGSTVTMVAEVVDPDQGDSHTCAVSWGDGTSGEVDAVDGVCTASRTYDVAGAYQLDVLATDAAGDTGSASVEVVVVDTAVTITGGGSLEGRAAPFNVSVRYRPGAAVPQGEVRLRTPAGDVRAQSLTWALTASDGSHALVAGTASVDGGPARPFRLLVIPGQRGSASLALTWTDEDGPGATLGPLGVQGGSIQLRG